MQGLTINRVQILALLCALWIVTLGCGGHSSFPMPTDPPPVTPNPPPPPGTGFGHVVLVVEENHSFSEVIGNASMPYLNNLATNYGVATQYFADTHPSIGNYFMLSTGVVVTNNEAVPPPPVKIDNVIRELLAANKTWKSYAESLPSVGYLGGDVYPYAQHHNPFVFIDDANVPAQVNNIVPFQPQFANDLAAAQLPNFSFVVPNQLNNAHDGTLAQADTWLKTNIDPFVTSPTFQKDGLLIIVFDESDFIDLAHGGGQVAAIVVSPHSKKGFQSTTFYQHESTLRLVLKGLGVTTFPGASATAPDMTEFFQ